MRELHGSPVLLGQSRCEVIGDVDVEPDQSAGVVGLEGRVVWVRAVRHLPFVQDVVQGASLRYIRELCGLLVYPLVVWSIAVMVTVIGSEFIRSIGAIRVAVVEPVSGDCLAVIADEVRLEVVVAPS